jgi:hypothetical protein
VHDFERLRTPASGLQKQHMRRERIADRRVKAQRPRAYGPQFSLGQGISACEQGDIMTERDQLFSQERNDPFGAPVELWWYRLI